MNVGRLDCSWDLGPLDPLGGSKMGTSSAGILRYFFRGGREGLSRQDLQALTPLTETYRGVWGTSASALLRAEPLLDDAILQRMVGQDDHPALRAKQAYITVKTPLQLSQFVVDRNSERLKDPRKGL